MARKRKDASPPEMELKQPDRSGPSEKTLLQFAEESGLFQKAQQRKEEKKAKKTSRPVPDGAEKPALSPTAEKILDTLLWTVSLSILHGTLDVLVQHQYAIEIAWEAVIQRGFQALAVFGMLFFVLHPFASNPTVIPGVPLRFQRPLRQAIFTIAGTSAGCYLVHISNEHGYLAVMKQAPPLGCIWVWSVIELDLPLAVVSVAATAIFLWQGGYEIT